jgi:hypothetical protein
MDQLSFASLDFAAKKKRTAGTAADHLSTHLRIVRLDHCFERRPLHYGRHLGQEHVSLRARKQVTPFRSETCVKEEC